MADYYPLLARALEAMPDRSQALREAVYTRARGALIGQLRSLEPPLSENDIELESRALESAIRRLEDEYGVPPAPEPVAANAEPAPFVPLPTHETAAAPEALEPPPLEPPAPAADLPEATLPPASAPDLGGPAPTPVPDIPPPAPVPPEGAEPAVRIQARKGRTPFVSDETVSTEISDGTGDATPPVDALGLDGGNVRQRPRIDVVAPRGGRSRLLRNLAVGSVLLAVIGLIAVAAFLLRDKPGDLQPSTAEVQNGVQEGGETKFNDRVGGEPAPAERGPAQPRQTVAPAPTPSQPDVTVAQRAVLYEENTASGSNGAPVTTQGRVLWRLDTANGEQGQPLQTVVRANAEFPEAGLTLAMTLRRNLDTTLPASHIIELVFTPTGAPGEKHSVQDVGLLQAKDDEGARGSPVAGLPVRVRENLFLIGLSSLPSDVERNTDLLLNRNWFDLALKFTSGQRAILALEKGGSGAQVLQRSFEQWR